GGDSVAVARWSAILLAYRDTRETRMAERQIGRALARLLDDLDVPGAALWRRSDKACFVTLFTLAAVHWQLPAEHTAAAYAWTWVDSQVAAAIKLVPLGQTDGQRILLDAGARIPEVVACGGDLSDDEIGASAPAASLASAAHEIEYSRLFRS
ncbi:MAG: urease accessory UreF family protein, partial [Myxococcota bacterium]